MNRVVLIGRLTKDPELRFTPGAGTAVTTFILAVDRNFLSRDGQRETDFIPIVAWGRIAENTANYMSKGSQVGVSGRIQTRSYDAKDGTRRYVTEIVADEVQFLDKVGSNTNRSPDQGNGSSDPDDDIIPVDDEDIPF